MMEESSFEGLVSMDRDGEAFAMARFAEDVVTALDAFEFPTMTLSDSHEVLAGDLLHASRIP